MQMICALLIFQTPDLPAPLAQLSPWMEWLSLDREELLAGLAAQKHRRFIKTHTPLKGLLLDPRVTYVVVARHPLDMAVSLYYHYANLDARRLNELAGTPGRARRARCPRCGSGCCPGSLRLRPIPAARYSRRGDAPRR